MGLSSQAVAESGIAEGTVLTYNGATITLVAGDIPTAPITDGDGNPVGTIQDAQAAILQTKLRTLAGLETVSVVYAAGLQAGDGAYIVTLPTPLAVVHQASSAAGPTTADLQVVSLGSITLPLNLVGVTFRKGATAVPISLVGDPATVQTRLKTDLANLNGTVSVSGSGTEGDPWLIRLTDYNTATSVTAEYDFGTFADVTPDVLVTPAVSILNADVTVGTLFSYATNAVALTSTDISATRSIQATLLQTRLRTVTGDSQLTVTFDADRFYVNFAAATSGGLQMVSAATAQNATSGNDLQVQTISGNLIVADSVITYNNQPLILRNADINTSSVSGQASLLQTRLRTLTGLEAATVVYSSGGFVITIPGTGATQIRIASGETAVSVPASSVGLGTVYIKPVFNSFLFFRDGQASSFVPSEAADDAARRLALQTAVEAVMTGATVVVDDSQLSTVGYKVTIEGYDPTSPLRVTIDQGDFEALSANPLELISLVQQRDQAGNWVTLTRGAGTAGDPLELAVFSPGSGATSDDVYISPYMTIEKEGPKLIELPTWADLNGDGQVELTGQTDYFESRKIVTDNDVDVVTINGSSLRDYFLIGNEVTDGPLRDDNGELIREIHNDAVQVTQQRLTKNTSGKDIISGNRSIKITLRGIDLTNLENQVAPDQLFVNGAGGDDRLIAGMSPITEDHALPEYTYFDILAGRAIDGLNLIGGEGNDRIIGSRFNDTIRAGLGDDMVTGGAGTDVFVAEPNDTNGNLVDDGNDTLL